MLFTSKSCEEEPTAAEAREIKILHGELKTIENGMESDYLNQRSIPAYEEKAKQKTIEFADYLSLYTVHDLDSVLKSSLESQIKSLVFDRRVEIEYMSSKGVRKFRVDDFLNELSSTPYVQLLLTHDSVKIYQSLERQSEHQYMGIMSYMLTSSGILSNDTILLQQNRMLAEFYLKKVRKQFGSEVKFVWQVYLGDMNLYSNH